MGNEPINFYKILNVSPNADSKEVFAAYAAMTKKYSVPPGSPDSVIQRVESEFRIYQKAFDVLNNTEERKKHDNQLKLYDLKKQEEKLEQEIKEQERIKQAEDEIKRKIEQDKENDLQNYSPIKNDPRLKDTMSGFRFSQLKVNMYEQVDPAKKEAEQKEKQKSNEQFEKAKKYIEIEDYDAAIGVLRGLTETYYKEAVYHSYLGLALLKKGWDGYAQAEFKIALTHNPKESVALYYYQNSNAQIIKKTGALTQQKEPEKHEHSDSDSLFSKIKGLFGKNK